MSSEMALEKTVAVVAAYVSNNMVSPKDMPDVIRQVHTVISVLQGNAPPSSAFVHATPIEIAASIRYDRLVSFIDGKAYKSLKRHLAANGLTPGEYRSRYGLPLNYPMVSPAYADVRSRIAKQAYYGLETA